MGCSSPGGVKPVFEDIVSVGAPVSSWARASLSKEHSISSGKAFSLNRRRYGASIMSDDIQLRVRLKSIGHLITKHAPK